MHAYYLANPPIGGPLTFNYPNANCSWNITTELYRNVDGSRPVGFVTKFGGNAAASAPYAFSFNVTTSGPASLVSVLTTSDQIQNLADKPVGTTGETDMNYPTSGSPVVDGGGNEAIAGSYKVVNGAGTYTFGYNLNQASRWWTAQPLEIRAAICGPPSFTPTPSFAQTATPTPSPTNTATSTNTGTTTDTATISSSPTGTPSSTFTATPSVTASSTETPSYTNTASNTLTPSVTMTATQTLTNSPTFTPTATSSATSSPSTTPSFSASPTPTQSWTASATPQPVPHQVRVLVYNSAGELVKTLFQGEAQYQLGELKVDHELLLIGSTVNILFSGYLRSTATGALLNGLPWAAQNGSGQFVGNGIYVIKVEILDNFGQTTTLQHSIQVLSFVPENKLNIYNSAGELVISLNLPTGGTGRYNGLRLSADSLAVKADPISGAMLSAPLTLWLMDERGKEFPIQWSGLNAQGLPVASGSYTVGRLYNMTGERIAQADDRSNSGTLRFSGKSLASGIYVVKLEKVLGSAVEVRSILKVAIVH